LVPHLQELMLAREDKSGRSAPSEVMNILRFGGFLERHNLGIPTQESLCSFIEGEGGETSWMQGPWAALRSSFKLITSGKCL